MNYSDCFFALFFIFTGKVRAISHAKKVMFYFFRFHDGLIILSFGFLMRFNLSLSALMSLSMDSRIVMKVLA